MTRSARILRAGFAAIIFIAAMEVFARLDDYLAFRAPILSVYSDANLYENDELGKHGRPFARYRKWRLNEFGYRGPRVEPDRINIVCFGASETFGLHESENSEYPRQLERELNARANGAVYQVVNVAYPGQMLPTATERIPQIVERVHPRLALIYPSPAFYIDMPPKRLKRYVKADPVPDFEWRMNERLQNVIKSLLPGTVQTWIREWQISRSLGPKTAMDRLPEETITRFREDLTEMLTSLRSYGVDPVVLTHATVLGVTRSRSDRELLVAWRKFHPSLKEDGFPDAERRINQAMREVAEQQHVSLIDIAQQIPKDRVYFGDAAHFTDAGAALMASLLADALGPLLPQLSASRQATGPVAAAANAHKGAVTP